jgi:ABC-2 type transport system permease protein
MTGSLIRVWGFIRKEILSVLRQPRLVATLILAPFIILVLFGIGYRERPEAFKTELVLPSEQARLATEDLSEAFGAGIEMMGVSYDAEEAQTRLQRGDLDLLIIAPEGAVDTISQGERAKFVVAHTEVDPVLRATINLLSRLSVDEINRRVLTEVIRRVQEESAALDAGLGHLRDIAAQMVESMESGDTAQAENLRGELDAGLAEAEGPSGSSEAFYEGVAEALGTEEGSTLWSLREEVSQIDLDDPSAVEDMRRIHDSLEELDATLEQARSVPPEILVSPFSAEISEVSRMPSIPAVFYGPGALTVLLQHLALTFGALSLVRERELGLSEVFRVSPLGVSEALAGKYLAFTAIAGTVAAVLSAAMIAFGARVEDLGLFASILGLMILASLGLGFAVSAVARTNTQAVQYSMMILLVSIFFTGFVLPLEQLITPVRVVSFLLPATYGIVAMHDLMFRTTPVEPLIFGGLALYAAVFAVVAWWAVREDIGEPD